VVKISQNFVAFSECINLRSREEFTFVQIDYGHTVIDDRMLFFLSEILSVHTFLVIILVNAKRLSF
jgi:hypothetical protein